MLNYTEEYRRKQSDMGMTHVNPIVRSDADRVKVIAEAKRMRQSYGITSSEIEVAKRPGPAKYPKRVRVWVPLNEKRDMLKYAKEIRDT